MLVLSRTPGQIIHIGDSIEVHIFSINGDKVKIGVQAPAEVLIFRDELLERIKAGEPVRIKT